MERPDLNKEIISDIESWNVLYPFDRAWRQKYNIPYGSDAHKQMNVLDIYFQVQEDKLFAKLIEQEIARRKEGDYQPNRGDWLRPRKHTISDREQRRIDDAETLDDVLDLIEE